MESTEYISHGYQEHLLTDTDRQLSTQTAFGRIQAVRRLLCHFIDTYTYPYSCDRTFLHRSMDVPDPFGYFYLLAKIHKTPWTT